MCPVGLQMVEGPGQWERRREQSLAWLSSSADLGGFQLWLLRCYLTARSEWPLSLRGPFYFFLNLSHLSFVCVSQ